MFRPTLLNNGARPPRLITTDGFAGVSGRLVEGVQQNHLDPVEPGDYALQANDCTIDLSKPQVTNIFDVTVRNVGVGASQSFEILCDQNAIASNSAVFGGQNKLNSHVSTPSSDGSGAFKINVDDTLGKREIAVTGLEIAGSTVASVGQEPQQRASFSRKPGHKSVAFLADPTPARILGKYDQ